MNNTTNHDALQNISTDKRRELVVLYGLPYCDSTAAAIKWLEENDIENTLHNYKTDGITESKLTEWSKQLGWEKLLNKRSTTWRSLSKEKQDSIIDESTAIKAMMENTSLIKRPVIEYGNKLMVGFDEKRLKNLLG
jgi:arsenate reductase (glutaredoxin)